MCVNWSINLKDNLMPEKYIERDVSWMIFNHRVLQEAGKQTLPLFERLSFLGIYANNIDEFYRVRIATLNRILASTKKKHQEARRNARYILEKIEQLDEAYRIEYEAVFHDVIEGLKREYVFFLNEQELNGEQKTYLDNLFTESLYAHTTPLMLRKLKRMRQLEDDGIYLGVALTNIKEIIPSKKREYAIIKLPIERYGRVLKLLSTDTTTSFIFLDDVVRHCLSFIFSSEIYRVEGAYTFKFFKDAEMDLEKDVGKGLMERVERAVDSRKKGQILRLDYEKDMPAELLRLIIDKLEVAEEHIHPALGRYHNLKGLMKISGSKRPDLKYPLWPSLVPAVARSKTLLTEIRKKDCFFHFPYHNLSSFIHLLQEAATAEDVKSIKMTLYRLTKKSRVVETLIAAARNGKSVTVVIELLARFDETSNISWARKMQEAGIKVVFGQEGLKVHAKLMHIGSKKGDIACIATGNFHEVNARVYTDVFLMTGNQQVTKEVAEVFKFIEKPYFIPTINHLLFAPHGLRDRLYQMIDTEIKHAKDGKEAYIMAKLNHITDPGMVEKLYEASMAGVQIRLLIRGNCSLVTGEAFSENIRIHAIIDRFLEHSRILFFCNGGDERCFVGSTDWMSRNLNKRVEVMAPVYDKEVRDELRRIVEYGLKDTTQGRVVDGLGVNKFYASPTTPAFRSQEELYNHYKNTLDTR